jgi:CubicO group peptidase (beta-lactamase class C family)
VSSASERPPLALCESRELSASHPTWLATLADGLVEGGLVSAVTALVGSRRRVLAVASAGDARSASGGAPGLFDLASLTKPWTASLALRLDERGVLLLGTRIGEVWPACDASLGERSLGELLRHRAGFQPWAPLYRRCRSREAAVQLLLGGSLLGARRGTYSDLGYLLWAFTAERALGVSLADLLQQELVKPLGLRAVEPGTIRWLSCRLGNEREVSLGATQGVRIALTGPPEVGKVQDGNARFLGPLGGQAGLFATPGAIWALTREWLKPGALWSAAAAREALPGSEAFGLGWRRATRRGSGGAALAAGSYGHVGFTGGSVWVDPARDRILVLLAHRSAVSVDLAPVRRRFHREALTDASGN